MASSEAASVVLPRRLAAAMPAILGAAVAAPAWLDVVRLEPALTRSLVGAASVLLAWSVLLGIGMVGRGTLTIGVALRRQHYLQACAQIAIFAYWGWHWRPVYESAHLIAAQLLFAYAVDMLLAWSRHRSYTAGYGPFPVVLSINLFFWFKPDWFWLQFVMVASGFVAKDLIRWTRDGSRRHVFNPSSFPLALCSVVLLVSGTSHMTWGLEVASTQFYPPYIYTVLFLLAIPNGLVFGVASMTMSAVITTYLFGLGYFAATGVYYFYDTYVPIAVFLGMHFLVTDPSTAPRTELGRVMFGVMYGVSALALYGILGWAGLPTFYDKLLPVPLLNLSVRGLDRLARSPALAVVDPRRVGRQLGLPQRRAAYVALWAVVFVAMRLGGGVGDHHPGQWSPFWQDACADERRFACNYLIDMQASFCRAASGWGCNELGVLLAEHRDDEEGAEQSFRRGCDRGSQEACANASWLADRRGEPRRSQPLEHDLPIVLRGSKGPIADRDPHVLYALACERGFAELCDASTRSR